MDGTIGMSCQPVEISGRNYMLRHAAAELIRHDPAWNNGDYEELRRSPLHCGRQLPDRSPIRIQESADPRGGRRAL